MKKRSYLAVLLTALPLASYADGVAVDKVYHPYVQALEREVEWRMISADGEQKHRIGYGESISGRLFAEAYLIGEQNDSNDLKAEAIEFELKWQLSEQGEYDVDWGLITELEYEYNEDAWEVATGLILEKQWGRWVGTANGWLIYEHSDLSSEFETALALQSRYRYSRYLEPAIEFYAGQNTRSLGPVLMGDWRFGTGKNLHWEAGVVFGLDHNSPDNTWRFLTEYEF
jgi:hypothetical protein